MRTPNSLGISNRPPHSPHLKDADKHVFRGTPTAYPKISRTDLNSLPNRVVPPPLQPTLQPPFPRAIPTEPAPERSRPKPSEAVEPSSRRAAPVATGRLGTRCKRRPPMARCPSGGLPRLASSRSPQATEPRMYDGWELRPKRPGKSLGQEPLAAFGLGQQRKIKDTLRQIKHILKQT